MKRKNVKLLTMLTVVFMAFSVLSGCMVIESEPTSGQDSNSQTSASASGTSGEKVKLTLFTVFSEGQTPYFKTLNDSPNMQALEEATGVEVDILAVPSANYIERKGLMFASGDLPDIIYSSTAANDVFLYGVQDDLIIPLDDLIKEHAPNLSAWIASEPQIREQSRALDGQMYHFPGITYSNTKWVGQGYFAREDWLKKYNIEPPKTIDELYEVLRLYKEKDPAGNGKTIPMSAQNPTHLINSILWAFGTPLEAYQVDGKVKYGPVEPEFKEALRFFRKLYDEKLIASDYLTWDTQIYGANVIDNIGITYGYRLSAVKNHFLAAGYSEDEIDNAWRPIAGPTGSDGKFYGFASAFGRVVSAAIGEFISSSCKHPVEAIKWMDYKFSQEGALTVLYGKKGVTWDYDANGVYYITDFVLNNPGGIEPQEVLLRNGAMVWGYLAVPPVTTANPTSRWPFTADDVDINRHFYGTAEKSLYTESIGSWFETSVDRKMPPAIQYTQEEQETINVLMQDINTLVSENLHRVIMGLEPIEKWDEVVKQLKDMDVEKYLATHQAALDRMK